MPIRRCTLGLAALMAFGQEVQPFRPEVADPWKPAWELTLRGDRLGSPGDTGDSFRRAGLQLRLRWSWDLDALHLEAGTRSAVGSDGNAFNAPRWDQQPSNGTQLDVAHGDLSWAREHGFGTLRLGFQENGLLSSQALWDRDLRFLGAGGMAGLRDSGGLVQEAGLRASVGRVRHPLGGEMDLAAGQAVLKLDTGAWSWTAHAGRWNLAWNPGHERLRALPGASLFSRQKLVLDAGGASVRWNARLPLEGRWFAAKNRATGDSSEEVQATAGSRERVYWPELAITYQRLSSTGTLYPVNGDEWWLYRRVKGHRADLSLPLPGHWLLTFIYLRQRTDGEDYQITRSQFVVIKRF